MSNNAQNIPGFTAYRFNKSYPKEVTHSPHHSSYQKYWCMEVSNNNKDVYKYIVVDVQNLIFARVNGIESESSVVKD